jgi:hypothetical protein
MAVPFQKNIRAEDAHHLLAGLVAEQIKKYVRCFVLHFGFLYYGSILIVGFLFYLM